MKEYSETIESRKLILENNFEELKNFHYKEMKLLEKIKEQGKNFEIN